MLIYCTFIRKIKRQRRQRKGLDEMLEKYEQNPEITLNLKMLGARNVF